MKNIFILIVVLIFTLGCEDSNDLADGTITAEKAISLIADQEVDCQLYGLYSTYLGTDENGEDVYDEFWNLEPNRSYEVNRPSSICNETLRGLISPNDFQFQFNSSGAVEIYSNRYSVSGCRGETNEYTEQDYTSYQTQNWAIDNNTILLSISDFAVIKLNNFEIKTEVINLTDGTTQEIKTLDMFSPQLWNNILTLDEAIAIDSKSLTRLNCILPK